jgi:hypothetical protein
MTMFKKHEVLLYEVSVLTQPCTLDFHGVTTHAEVEIPVASNWRPIVDKTLVTSNLESIMVTSDVDMFLSYA